METPLSTVSRNFRRCLWVTSTHPYWGTAHYLRAQAVKFFFSSSDKYQVVLDIIEVVLSEEEHAELQQSEIIRSSQDIRIHTDDSVTKEHIPSFTSLAGLSGWLGGKSNHYSAVVIDRREPPPVLIEMLSVLGIPLIGFDLKAYLPIKNQRLKESYSRVLTKLDYIVNAIPGLEQSWANLNESEYLLSPFFLQNQNFSFKERVVKEKKICCYLGYINNPVYLKSTLIAITHFLVLYADELTKLIGDKKPAGQTKTVYISVAAVQVAHIAKMVKEIQHDRAELQGITYVVESVKEFTGAIESDMYDEVGILFTHFGMFGLECLSIGIPVFFSHPSIYHQELVRRHFPELELNQVIWDSHNSSLFARSTSNFGGGGSRAHTVCEIIAKLCLPTLKEQVKKICELCGGATQIVHRRQWMNLAQCQTCKSVRLLELFKKSDRIKWGWEEAEDYDADYFIQEYEESYGKTYRDDEAVIKAMAKDRLAHIRLYSGDLNTKPKLLDIGCAYGFFLDVAFEQGYATYGVDISEHAGGEVSSSHTFQCGNFLTDELEITSAPNAFDVVTLWYVMEHFADLATVVQRVDKLLLPGGILAFSTPNADGLSARYSPKAFFQTSPKDHYYIFSLPGLRRYFARYGYELMGFRATGIHYKRFKHLFPHLSKVIPQVLYRVWAERKNLGDTMEVYFRKIS